MRRAFRWLFVGLCWLSLVAGLGTAWLWMRSWEGGPQGPPYRPYAPVAGVIGTVLGELACVRCVDGDIQAHVIGAWPTAERVRYYSVRRGEESPSPELFPQARAPADVDWGGPSWHAGRCTRVAALDQEGRPVLMGSWVGRRVSGPLTVWWCGAPAWSVIAPLWLLPLLCCVRRARNALCLRRRRRLGLCRHCGYDLTANASGTCPECGNATVWGMVTTQQHGIALSEK
jgi:hypothetical protein